MNADAVGQDRGSMARRDPATDVKLAKEANGLMQRTGL